MVQLDGKTEARGSCEGHEIARAPRSASSAQRSAGQSNASQRRSLAKCCPICCPAPDFGFRMVLDFRLSPWKDWWAVTGSELLACER